MDGSSFSSFYSSFIKTTDGSESPPDNDKEMKHRKIKVVLTPQNVYQVVISFIDTQPVSQTDNKIVEHPEEDQTQHGDG